MGQIEIIFGTFQRMILEVKVVSLFHLKRFVHWQRIPRILTTGNCTLWPSTRMIQSLYLSQVRSLSSFKLKRRWWLRTGSYDFSLSFRPAPSKFVCQTPQHWIGTCGDVENLLEREFFLIFSFSTLRELEKNRRRGIFVGSWVLYTDGVRSPKKLNLFLVSQWALREKLKCEER